MTKNKKILSNQVKCNKCGDTPFSTSVHDFKYCKCGSIAVDGGMSYLRRVGDINNYEDIYNECIKAIKWARETGRNDLGVLCAIMRTLRDKKF